MSAVPVPALPGVFSRASFSTPGGVFNATPPRVVFGAGTSDHLAAEVDRLGAARALVITTPGRAAMGRRYVEALGDRTVGILPEAISQVPIELARRGRQRAAELGVDCLIAVGGGAATGLCKGIAYESELPIVAIPTTYSGSEMTGFCGMTIDGVKRMHESIAMRPSVVIYDPLLSAGLPVRISAASALNALAHCIDAVYLPWVSPLLRPACIEGAAVLVDALPRLLADPGDIGVRTDLLYGAFLGGAALTGGFEIQHAIAHMLGGSFEVEHGTAHALVLPYVTKYLVESAPGALGVIAEAVGAPDDLPGRLWDLAAAAELPLRLSEVGLGTDDIDRAIEIATTADDHDDPRLVGNPAPATDEAVRDILRAAAEGTRP